ncbi:MAG: dUTP diphosphatase, partial [Nanoarchaeota archaeon]|nr:dUTP diphosphatase [Nanoarchaeota archaeon]
GELGVVLIKHGQEDFEISKGDMIAQIVINKIEIVNLHEVMDLPGSLRGEQGFGSTGVSKF